MLPRFSIAKQRTASIDTVLLNMSWGTLEFGFTISKKPLVSDFEDELYPHQRSRNLFAIIFMALVHLIVIYFLLLNKTEPPLKQGEEAGQLVFFDLQGKKDGAQKPKPAKTQPEKKQQQKQPRNPNAIAAAPQAVVSPPTNSPVAAPPVVDTMSQIAAARERRRASEAEAAEQNSEAQAASNGPSENDIAMARIKANIQAANYSRKGTNGVFQILRKGVQNGSFSFRGWTNDPRQSSHQTYEVDAGIGGDVKLAIIRKMIELIREHYTGDFNWESQRLGRVVPLSARPADNAGLEAFLMKEFPD
ncbi:hypothetical protein [Solimicrobium silvestre]|uniref:Uncharacterized protein n=1 Tax=Solimicrobium silvestre TaxID=2099400 RepID=A0A2S9H067_9BURK|nr:hypothetical protein [Solimicrobium silvestre]PRC93371.1 hypothetical protein S2091_1758 [Solimicrobium silvestre]